MPKNVKIKKENIYKYMYALSILLLFGFVFRLGADYYKYDPIVTSAPFSVYIIIRLSEFIVPGIICFVAGMICKNKFQEKDV